MKENFKPSLALVLESEGGYVDDPRDPGGATNKGITLATLRRFQPGADKAALKNIRPDTVAFIYKTDYWNKVGADGLPAGIDYCVFDYAVNSGTDRANAALKAAMPQKGQAKTDSQIITDICDARYKFLRGLRNFATYGKVWTNRLHFVKEEALKMNKNSAAVA